MRREVHDKTLRTFEAKLKKVVQNLLERLMLKGAERSISKTIHRG